MLPRQYRLPLRTERNRVTAMAENHHSPFFTLISAPQILNLKSQISNNSRFAVITSTKLHPHAVERHRVKRLIHQIIQENLNLLPRGRDVIIIPKKTTLTADKTTLTSDLIKLIV